MHEHSTATRSDQAAARSGHPTGSRRLAVGAATAVAAAAIAVTGMLGGQMNGAWASASGAGQSAKPTHATSKHGKHSNWHKQKHKHPHHQSTQRHTHPAKHSQAHATKTTTEPTPAPATTPTPIAAPVAPRSGTPSASDTGVPAGTKLTVHNGDINITKAGTVIDGLDIHGAIKVNAPNVTIKNSIIRFRDGGYIDGIHSYSTGLKILDTEIAPTNPSPNYNGIMGSQFTATRVNIHGVVDAVHIYGDNDVVQDSWLHNNAHYEQDPNWNGKPSHDDSIQIVSGNNIRILNNNYDNAHNSGIQITQDSGTVSNVTIDGNLAGGGGCSVNVSEKGGGPISGIAVTNNKFYRDQKVAGCAIIRPVSTTVTAKGNSWLDSGAQVTLSRG